MTNKLPAKDVVIIGLGWTGAILANELTNQGLDVVAIERGPWRDTATTFNIGYTADEWRNYASQFDLFQRPAQSTLTFRNNDRQTALPVRQWGSFLPGNGVGGAGVHWGGQTWRYLPTDFRLRSHLTERYGVKAIPNELAIQDWGVTYEELEPYYDEFEHLAGISGKAGNIKGVIQAGGNPFEGPRSREYPLPPMRNTYAPTVFAEAAQAVGYHPFSSPAATLSANYTNPLGVRMAECTYCGFCVGYACGNYSKASPQTCVLPVLMRKSNFEARTECEVLKVNLDRFSTRATGVTYVDSSGKEWEQPAELVLICTFAFNNVHMMLMSGIGRPYDPKTRQGTVGRNYAYQTMSSAQVFFDDKIFNPFISSGACGQSVDDFNGDNFDHGGLGFIGGASISCQYTDCRPLAKLPVPPGTPRWGARWKAEVKKNYLRSFGFTAQGSSYAAHTNYLDLDPTYTDRFGRPLLRLTFDFPDNDIRMANYLGDKLELIAKAMNARQYVVSRRTKPYSVVPVQSAHYTGGAIMGTDPKSSAVNKYLQSWDVPNVFVVGSSAFPQNAGYNPNDTVCALAYFAADALISKYLKSPGPLLQK
jgi:gluconate 2-dehydrogenase alpha chain